VVEAETQFDTHIVILDILDTYIIKKTQFDK